MKTVKELAKERFERANQDPYATMTLEEWEDYYKGRRAENSLSFMFGDLCKVHQEVKKNKETGEDEVKLKWYRAFWDGTGFQLCLLGVFTALIFIVSYVV